MNNIEIANSLAKNLAKKILTEHGDRGLDVAVEQAKDVSNLFNELCETVLQDNHDPHALQICDVLDQLYFAIKRERDLKNKRQLTLYLEIVEQNWFNNLC